MTTPEEIGKSAPSFKVKVSDDEFASKEDYKGKKLVLYFYPKDNTPGCTQETQDFCEHYEEFLNNGAHILGVSKDSLKSHKKFIDKLSIPFLLGSDEECEICEAFKVWVEKSMYGKKYMGIERSTFLIDENGNFQKVWRKVSVKGHVNDVLNEVKK